MGSSSVTTAAPVPRAKAVAIWLFVVAFLIAAMVTVGGLTRMTDSGLSITEWHPVTGVIPPPDARSWAEEFAKYRRIPQYRLEHPHMTMADFKTIYWWEWSHRLLGRLLGAAFLVPLLYFVATGAISRADLPRMFGLFALGGLQGFVGWWMVESGLETRVSVSQYRLAIHLGVAIILLGAVLWAALDYMRLVRADFAPSIGRTTPAGNGGRWLAVCALAFVALVYVQMLLGAIAAGLHAGLIYNTWPSMNGRLFPEDPFFHHPWWVNFGDDPGLAQFDHRIGAYIVALSALGLWIARRRTHGEARLTANILLGVTVFQIVLGIEAVLNQAPLPLAVLHQATAVALFAAAVWHAHAARSAPMPPPAPDRGPQ